jgi:copper chaperone CopZ
MNTNEVKSTVKTRQAGCCCSSNKTVAINNFENVECKAGSDFSLHHLQVEGATCGGCVKKIEQALLSVSSVTSAKMNLANGVALVNGVVQPRDLIESLENVGFPAKVLN